MGDGVVCEEKGRDEESMDGRLSFKSSCVWRLGEEGRGGFIDEEEFGGFIVVFCAGGTIGF